MNYPKVGTSLYGTRLLARTNGNKDGHHWVTRKNSNYVREDQENLKVPEHDDIIKWCYTHGKCDSEITSPTLKRRAYWLPKSDNQYIIIHYLDEELVSQNKISDQDFSKMFGKPNSTSNKDLESDIYADNTPPTDEKVLFQASWNKMDSDQNDQIGLKQNSNDDYESYFSSIKEPLEKTSVLNEFNYFFDDNEEMKEPLGIHNENWNLRNELISNQDIDQNMMSDSSIHLKFQNVNERLISLEKHLKPSPNAGKDHW